VGEGGLMLIPHPRDESFEIGLRPTEIASSLGISAQFGKTSEAVSADGRRLKEISLRREGGTLYLKTVPGAAAILLRPTR